ncbi:MAG TPA: C40 family peptidase [Luteimicrobium sp.]|jgi:cell wall-associated NlpC family hydrolase|nr:C40 family peptidase [Luteimicrobium sp.]
MLRTREQGAARPEGGRPRRFGRVATTTGLLVGLVGGGLVATAAATPAAAATTTQVVHKSTPTLSLKISDKSYYKNKPPVVKVTSKTRGKATTGKVYFRVSGKLVAIRTLKSGKATYRLSKHLKPGHHRVRATIHPAHPSTVKSRTKYTTVQTHKYSSRVVEKAVKYTGTRYVYGGSSPRGFDCSGFTKYVYSHTKVKSLPRTSSGQRHAGKVVSKKHAKPGDLVYTPGHVGIYVGGSKIIDAPRPGKSIHVRSMWKASWTFIHVKAKANTI